MFTAERTADRWTFLNACLLACLLVRSLARRPPCLSIRIGTLFQTHCPLGNERTDEQIDGWMDGWRADQPASQPARHRRTRRVSSKTGRRWHRRRGGQRVQPELLIVQLTVFIQVRLGQHEISCRYGDHHFLRRIFRRTTPVFN